MFIEYLLNLIRCNIKLYSIVKLLHLVKCYHNNLKVVKFSLMSKIKTY